MKELHLRMPAGLLDRLDAQRKKDGTTTDRSDFIRRLVEKEITRMENRAARDLVMTSQLPNHPPIRSSHRPTVGRSLGNGATEQSAASSTEQSSDSATGTGGN
jgi:Arc/MetJ-type ribon-helix-helix transcriptional regulator